MCRGLLRRWCPKFVDEKDRRGLPHIMVCAETVILLSLLMALQEKSDHRCPLSTGWSPKGSPHSTTSRYIEGDDDEEEEEGEEEEEEEEEEEHDDGDDENK